MNEEDIRIGDVVKATSGYESAWGKVESGHAGDWFVRTDAGELTGPWDADQLERELPRWLKDIMTHID